MDAPPEFFLNPLLLESMPVSWKLEASSSSINTTHLQLGKRAALVTSANTVKVESILAEKTCRPRILRCVKLALDARAF